MELITTSTFVFVLSFDVNEAAPSARMDDGLFDLVALKAGVATRGELLAILQQTPKGSHAGHPQVKMVQLKYAKFEFESPGVFNVDGEITKHDGCVEVSCCEKQLNVLADSSKIAGAWL